MWMVDILGNLVNLAGARAVGVVENESKHPGSHLLIVTYSDHDQRTLYRGSRTECESARSNVREQIGAVGGYVVNYVSQEETQTMPVVGEMAGQAEGWLQTCQ